MVVARESGDPVFQRSAFESMSRGVLDIAFAVYRLFA
jgi:hypothetical protein